MLETVGLKNVRATALKDFLGTTSTFEAWGGVVPSSATAVPAGTKGAEGPVPAGLMSVDTLTGKLTLGGLSDTRIDATILPTFIRIRKGSEVMQFTAKMQSNPAGGIEVVITDPTDAAATQLLQNRAFTSSITIQL